MRLTEKAVRQTVLAGIMFWSVSGLAYAGEEPAPEYNLDEVVVTATKTSKSISDVVPSISVITREMIEKFPGNTIPDLLTTLPGVAIESRGGPGGIAGISLRGLNGGPGSQKILLLIDGRPANFAYDGSINWNAVPLANVEKIEVIRGPASALYGANAFGGVINVITRKPEKNDTSMNFQYGSFATKRYSLVQTGKDEKLAYSFTAGAERSDGSRERSDYDAQNYTLRLDYDVNPNTSLSLSAGYHTDDRGIAGSKTSPQNYYRDKTDANYFDVQSKTVAGNTANTIRLYTHSSKTESTKTASADLASRMEDRNTGLLFQQDVNVSAKKIITWGIDYQKQTATDRLNSHEYDASTSAVYVQMDQALTDKWNLNIGARLDHHSAFGNEVSPKIGAIYQTAPDVRLKFNVAKSFKAPSLADLYSTSSSALGDPNLKPTEMWTYEMAVEKQFNPNTLGKITFYKNEATDMIINERQADGTRKKKNVGNIRPEGIELELSRKFNEKWDAFVNYTYLDVGEMTYLASRHKANIGVNYVEFPFKITLVEQYASKSYARDYFQMPIAGHAVTNLKITYSPRKDYEISLGIENLFDRYYEEYLGYPMPGRTITSSFTWKF